jgi:predicted nucleic-acid-binding protein
MTGLDANILVRLVIEDDASQFAVVKRMMDGFTEDDPGFISLVALAEMVWVLRRVYGVPSLEVADVVERLLQTESLVVQNADEAYLAVRSVQSGTGTFADALIAALGQWAGCYTTLTFDVKASRLDGFTRV